MIQTRQLVILVRIVQEKFTASPPSPPTPSHLHQNKQFHFKVQNVFYECIFRTSVSKNQDFYKDIGNLSVPYTPVLTVLAVAWQVSEEAIPFLGEKLKIDGIFLSFSPTTGLVSKSTHICDLSA